jgi:RNA-binding protein
MAHTYTATLSSQQRAGLKAKSHHLQPIVMIGNKGLVESTVSEISQALSHHELIKIQLPGANTASDKKTLEDALKAALPVHAHFVNRIGRSVVLYLELDPEKAKLPLRDFKKSRTSKLSLD